MNLSLILQPGFMYICTCVSRYLLIYFICNLDFILNKVGAKYEEENEKDLKDQMDFPSPPNVPTQLS